MAQAGRIVEYIEQGRFVCGLVVGDEGNRLRLVNQNGREVKLPVARVLHQTTRPVLAGETREDLQRYLQEVNGLRRELMAQVDLQEIWNLASEEREDSFSPEFLAGLCFGEDANEDQVAAFLRTIFTDRLFFKYREGNIIVHVPEQVEQLRVKAEKEQEKEKLLDGGAMGLGSLRRGEDPGPWPERQRCLELVRDYYLFGNDFAESDLARDLLKRAQLTGDHEVYHLLVKAGIWRENENIPLLRYQVPVAFSEETLREAADCPEPELATLLAEGYRDLTDLPILTIDGEMTRDLDDGLHLEKKGDNYLVGIHIADVSRYVAPGGAMFEEARNRCTSLYFPDGQVAMLPEQLSEGVCSLIEGKVRAATSIMVLLSPTGEIIEYSVVPSAVRVRRRLTYAGSDQLLEQDEDLRILSRLSKSLRERRVAGGALLMPIPDVLISIGDDSGVEVRLEDGDSGSRSLVAEFMVLANILAASYVADRQVPGLFRSQEKPHKRFFEGMNFDLFLNFRQRRFLRPAKITTQPLPHSCVGAVQYTTMTSPIRRFLDLVMQHQLVNILKGKGIKFNEKELNGYLAGITRIQTRANLVRRLRHRFWLLKYLEANSDELFEALVIDRNPRRVSVALTDILIEGDLPPNQGVRVEPGDLIKVRIGKVKPLDDLLRLEW